MVARRRSTTPATAAGRRSLRPRPRSASSSASPARSSWSFRWAPGSVIRIWRARSEEAGVADDVADDVVQRIADSYVGWQENSFPGLLGNVVAGRIANRLDLGGTNCVVDAACASSLSAVHLACLELADRPRRHGRSPAASTHSTTFSCTCASARRRPCRRPATPGRSTPPPTARSSARAWACLLLKRLADAERDGDRIYAVIRGIGTSSDGKGQGDLRAQRRRPGRRRCGRPTALAGVTPDTIELVEAHGTGTQVGDAAEVEALTEVYRATRPRRATLVRPGLGQVADRPHQGGGRRGRADQGGAGAASQGVAADHQGDAAARAAGRRGKSPFYVNTEKRPWLPARAAIRAARPSAPSASAAAISTASSKKHGPTKAGHRLGRRRADPRLLRRNRRRTCARGRDVSGYVALGAAPHRGSAGSFGLSRHRGVPSGYRAGERQERHCQGARRRARPDADVRGPSVLVDAGGRFLRQGRSGRQAGPGVRRPGLAVRRHVPRVGLPLPDDGGRAGRGRPGLRRRGRGRPGR